MIATSDLLKAGLKLLLVCAVGFFIYTLTYNKGVHDERALWEKKENARSVEMATLRGEYAAKEENSRRRIAALSTTLQETKGNHEKELAAIDAKYTVRLQSSAQRAGVYQRQAAGSALDIRNLAEHTAKLDASLEEGRRLVEEFRTTLRLRDEQLITLGQVIQADRELLTVQDK